MSTCLEDEYRPFNSTHGSIVYWVSWLSGRRESEGCWSSTFSFYLCAVSTLWHTLSDHILCNDFWTDSSRNNTPVIHNQHAPVVGCKHKKRYMQHNFRVCQVELRNKTPRWCTTADLTNVCKHLLYIKSNRALVYQEHQILGTLSLRFNNVPLR